VRPATRPRPASSPGRGGPAGRTTSGITKPAPPRTIPTDRELSYEVAILGTGAVGQTLAHQLDTQGHSVAVGTRDPQATLARNGPGDGHGPSFGAWHGNHPGVTVATFADAAADADLVMNACSGAAALTALKLAGSENLSGKPLVDISVPIDFSHGQPPTLFVKDTDSLAEQIQRSFPETKVVEALNTLSASLMADSTSLTGSGTLFVAGDDASAKAKVVTLLNGFGHDDVIDLGGLRAARGTEMLFPFWLSLATALGTTQFNLKVVR
jgi:predicted dinucleotide-binding enzyme